MKFKAIKVKGKDLMPGDLFSELDEDFWDNDIPAWAVGEKVYVRTDAPMPREDMNEDIYRIELVFETND
jgi:hypothetical protein